MRLAWEAPGMPDTAYLQQWCSIRTIIARRDSLEIRVKRNMLTSTLVLCHRKIPA